MSTPNEEKDTALVSHNTHPSFAPPMRPGAKTRSLLANTPPQSHSPSTEPLSETLASTNPSAATGPAETETPPPEAGDGLDLGLMKKKKKKTVKIADDAEPAGDDAAAEGDNGLGILSTARAASLEDALADVNGNRPRNQEEEEELQEGAKGGRG